MKDEKSPLMVSIRCLTYNHEPHIRQCLEGFVMQQTNFRFEAIVHDDASTDGTAIIIHEFAEKYPEIIKPIYETENQYSKRDGSLTRILNNACKGKYIAVCEGDDCWTDPHKLQKQVDFLEKNTTYGLCYTKVIIKKGNQTIGEMGTPDTSFAGLLTYSNFPTLTRVYRKTIWDMYFEEVDPYSKKWLIGDYPMALYCSLKSKIKYLDEFSGVYRIVENSASHSKDIDYLFHFYDNADEIRYYFVDKFVSDELEKQSYYKIIKTNEIGYKILQYLKERKQIEARQLYIKHKESFEGHSRIIYDLKTRSLIFNRIVNFLIKVIEKAKVFRK